MSGQSPDRPQPGVYVGTIRHRRRLPVVHEFVYPLFMVLLDLDRIPELMAVSPFTSHNRWNWGSFRDSDHLRGAGGFDPGGWPRLVRDRLAAAAAEEGIAVPDGPVFLLTHLRYLGHVFNPISLFYCGTRDGTPARVLAEVSNTFGGSHRYWLTPDAADGVARSFRATAAKQLYVSPFMEPDLTYTFRLTGPGAHLVAHIDAVRDGQALFDATLSLERRPWTRAEVHRSLVRHPWMTAKVVAAIHWEAFRLWRKGLRVVPRETRTEETGDDRHEERTGASHVLRGTGSNPGRIPSARRPRVDVPIRRV